MKQSNMTVNNFWPGRFPPAFCSKSCFILLVEPSDKTYSRPYRLPSDLMTPDTTAIYNISQLTIWKRTIINPASRAGSKWFGVVPVCTFHCYFSHA